MKPITDDDLLNYLDNGIDDTFRKEIESLLQADQRLANRMKELTMVHQILSKKNKLDIPSKNFTDKVMGRLHEKPTLFFLSPKNGLLLLGGILVASGLTLAVLSSGSFDQLHTFFNLQNVPLKTDFIKLPSTLPFDLKIVLKIFLVLNLFIGFILLDRTILRPIFQKRSVQYQ
jgi:hypothetical protein